VPSTAAQPARRRDRIGVDQAVALCEIAVVIPERIGGDVGHKYRLAAMRGGAARSDAVADLEAIDQRGVCSGERGSRGEAQMPAVGIEHQQRAHRASDLMFDERDQLIERALEWCIGGDALEDGGLPVIP
jgi:hypothetical protein